jgi:hypothetical protein
MVAWRSTAHRKTPRFSRPLASLAKNPSTGLSHEHEVGVKDGNPSQDSNVRFDPLARSCASHLKHCTRWSSRRSLHCGISIRPMSESGHFRPSSAWFAYRPLPLSPKSGHRLHPLDHDPVGHYGIMTKWRCLPLSNPACHRLVSNRQPGRAGCTRSSTTAIG